MTVLGDFGQAIFTQATNLYGSSSPLLKLYGEEETSQFLLVRSYRSTLRLWSLRSGCCPAVRRLWLLNGGAGSRY